MNETGRKEWKESERNEVLVEEIRAEPRGRGAERAEGGPPVAGGAPVDLRKKQKRVVSLLEE